MGFLDRLAGGGRPKEVPKEEPKAEIVADAPSASPRPSSELQHEVPSSSAYGPPKIDPHSMPNSIPGLTAMPDLGAGPSKRFYDPYEGRHAAARAQSHPAHQAGQDGHAAVLHSLLGLCQHLRSAQQQRGSRALSQRCSCALQG